MREPVSDCPLSNVLAAIQQACSRAAFSMLQRLKLFRSANKGILYDCEGSDIVKDTVLTVLMVA